MRKNSFVLLRVLLAAIVLIAPLLTTAAYSGKPQAPQATMSRASLLKGAAAKSRLQIPDSIPTGEHAWMLKPEVFDHLSSGGRQKALYMNGLLNMSGHKAGEAPAARNVEITPQAATPFQNVRATADDGSTHSETSLVVNGQTVIETFNQSSPNSVSGYSRSTDGGATFSQSDFPSPSSILNFGDGVTTLGANGEIYFSELAFSLTGGFDEVGVAKSTDNGLVFSSPVDASVTLNKASSTQDKPWITVDKSSSSPHKGTVYLSWTDITQNNGEFVVVARSTDAGVTFAKPVTVSATGPSAVASGSVPGVDQNGNVFVAYLNFSEGGNNQVGIDVVKSTDGGATFAPAVTASIFNSIGVMTGGGGVRDNDFPSMSIDNNGTVHIIYDAAPATIPAADRSDIYYVRSTDGGATFSNPLKVNDDGTTTTQFMPSIVAAPNGSIGAIWYDRRNDPAKDALTDVYMAISTDGGSSFGKNFRITDHNWVFGTIEPGFAASYHGDYIQISADASNFYLSFADERGNGPDAYFVPVPLGTNPAAADFNISATNVYGTVTAGNSIQFNLTTNGVNGLSSALAFSAPAVITSGATGLSFNFANTSVPVGSPGNLTVSTSGATPPGTYLVSASATGAALTRSTNFRITVYPQGAPGSSPVNASNSSGFSTLHNGLQADSTGILHLAFDDDTGVGAGGSNVDYVKSTDGGHTYSAPVIVSKNSPISFNSALTLDAVTGKVYVAWTTFDAGNFTIFVSSSSDHGNTFSTPVSVTPAFQIADLANIATDSHGNLTVAYLEFTNQPTLFTVRSTNGGGTFSAPLQVSGNSEIVSTIGDSIAFSPAGTALLAYVDAAATPTLKLASATDGLHFAKAVTLSDGVTSADAPNITVASDGEVYLSFYEVVPVGRNVNREVMLLKSCDGGATFGATLNISQNVGQSRFPAAGVDRNGVIYVAWEDTETDPQDDILLARSTDGGATFSQVGNISANQGLSVGANITFDAGNNALLAWTDDDTAETDIFTSTVPGVIIPPVAAQVAPDFAVVFGTAEFDVTRGSTVTLPVFISRSGGFAGNVTVNPTNAGALKLKFKPFSKSTTCSSVSFVVKVKGGAKIGAHGLTFSAVDGTGRTRTGTLNLVVN